MAGLSSSSTLLGRKDLFLLDPSVAFLNHGSFGACPRAVLDDYQEWQRRLELEPVDFLGRQAPVLLRAAQERLAAELGATTDELALVTNATMGINIVAQSLDLQPGDEILTTDLEYGATDRVWDTVAARSSSRVVRVPVPLRSGSQEAVIEAVWAGVTGKTRVLAVSHVTSGTAVILPIAGLILRARQQGLVTVIDGAHAPGQIPVDLGLLGADFYSGNCHKWMMAPKGSGFLYARAERQGLVRPLVISHRLADATEPARRFGLEQQMQGTRDPAAFLAIPAALAFAEEHHWVGVRRAAHELLCATLEQVSTVTGEPSLLPLSPDWFAQMAIAALPACDGARLGRLLWEQHRVEVPVVQWQGHWFLRISIQGYNDEGDCERLVGALADLLPTVRE